MNTSRKNPSTGKLLTGVMNSRRSQAGAVMVWVIVLVVIAAGLGAVMMSITLDNPVMESISSESVRAHYLAEAGARYALPIIKGNFYNPDEVVSLLDGKGMIFDDGVNSFTLEISYIFDQAKGIVYSLNSSGERNATNATAPADYEVVDAEAVVAGFIFGTGNDRITVQRDIVDTSTGSTGGDDGYSDRNHGHHNDDFDQDNSGSSGSDVGDTEVKVICLYEWPSYRESGWYPVSSSTIESGSSGSSGSDDGGGNDDNFCNPEDAPPNAPAGSLDVKHLF